MLKRGDHDTASASRRSARDSPPRDSARQLGLHGSCRDGATVYDRALAGAVANFQAHHGIVVDSMLGDSTVQSMNVPARLPARPDRRQPRATALAAARPRAALHHRERSRVPPAGVRQRAEGARDEGHRRRRSTRARRRRCSPTRWRRSSSVRTGRSRPTSRRKEIEPKIAADPGYLDANDMEYYKDGGETRIRQRPGDKNSLGLVKFLFPNDFNIYLHDTPEPRAVQQGRARVQPRLHPPREARRARARGCSAGRWTRCRRPSTARTTTRVRAAEEAARLHHLLHDVHRATASSTSATTCTGATTSWCRKSRRRRAPTPKLRRTSRRSASWSTTDQRGHLRQQLAREESDRGHAPRKDPARRAVGPHAPRRGRERRERRAPRVR